MPVYRAPVFEDASGRAPGAQLRPDYIVRAVLEAKAKVEDCGSFFRVTVARPSCQAGWRPAGYADLKAPVVVAKAKEVPVLVVIAVPAPSAAPKSEEKIEELHESKIEALPELDGAEPPKKKRKK